MRPELLNNKDGTTTGLWVCGQCQNAHNSEGQATKCCTDRRCPNCGLAVLKYYESLCPACFKVQADKVEKSNFDKAEKVTDWMGWVFCDGETGVSKSEEFFPSTKEFAERMMDEGIELPKYVWACKEKPFPGLDLDFALENLCDNLFEDAIDHVKGIDELSKAVEKFNELNKSLVAYNPDYSKAVMLRAREVEL